jgi:hypothetical protein
MARIAATSKADASICATPERLAHAKAAGMTIIKEKITPEDGRTGVIRRQIEHPIDTARRRDWITAEMHAAGCRIRALMDGARTEPRITSRYLAAVDGDASSGMSTSDRREYCARCYIRAKAAIRERERTRFVHWLEECELMDMSVKMLGEWFTPRKQADAVNEAGIWVLNSVLGDLADHFGY